MSKEKIRPLTNDEYKVIMAHVRGGYIDNNNNTAEPNNLVYLSLLLYSNTDNTTEYAVGNKKPIYLLGDLSLDDLKKCIEKIADYLALTEISIESFRKI